MQNVSGEGQIAEPDVTTIERAPWAVALNETTSTEGLTVTLLSLTVVGDIIRVSALVRLVDRPDAQLVSIPTLVLGAIGGPPLGLIRAHVLPDGRLVWVTWTYERPDGSAAEFAARIDQVELAYRGGGVARETMIGPWDFRFRIPGGPAPAASSLGGVVADPH